MTGFDVGAVMFQIGSLLQGIFCAHIICEHPKKFVGASLLAMRPGKTAQNSTLLKHFLGPLLNLLLSQILLARGQKP